MMPEERGHGFSLVAKQGKTLTGGFNITENSFSLGLFPGFLIMQLYYFFLYIFSQNLTNRRLIKGDGKYPVFLEVHLLPQAPTLAICSAHSQVWLCKKFPGLVV